MKDPLEQLLHRARVLSRKEEKAKITEAEAAERAAKRVRTEEIRSAFDAERFRFMARLAGKTLEEFRRQIDSEIHKQRAKKP